MTTWAGQRQTSGHGRRGRRGALVLALALGAATTLSGCSGDDAAGRSDSSPSASSSPSATATTKAASDTPSTAAEKPPKAPKPVKGPAGQKAFAQHVMALWGYALRTDDARPLTQLSPEATLCKGCEPFAASMEKRRKQGWYVDFPGVKVAKITTKKVDDNVYAKASVTIPQSDSYNTDGSFRNQNKAHKGATFEVLMHRSADGFRLLAFTVS